MKIKIWELKGFGQIITFILLFHNTVATDISPKCEPKCIQDCLVPWDCK